VAGDAVLVPERDRRHVLGEQPLRLLVLLDGRGGVVGGVGLVDEVVELLVAVLAVVRGGAGVVRGRQEVLDQRVVHLPAGAERALEAAVHDLGAEVGEGADGVDDAGVLLAERLVDAVADRVHPLPVGAGVDVRGDRQLAAGEAAGAVDELLGLLRVVRAQVAADRVVEAALLADDRGGPVLGGHAGVVVDLLGDLLAVDRHGDPAPQVGLVGAGPGVVVERVGEGLDDAGLLVDEPVAEVALGVRELAGGQFVGDVEVAGLEVGVGGVLVRVDLQLDAVVLGLVVARVLVVLHELHRRALVVRLDLVRAVADGLVEPRGVVVEERLRQRREGRVAEGVGPDGELLRQLDGERPVVHDLQPGELLRARLAALGGRVDLVVALDVLEEAAVDLPVLDVRRVVPGVHEGLGLDRLAVAEPEALLDLDGPVLLVVALDGLGEHVLRLGGLRVVDDEPAGDQLEDLAALDLVGVRRLQRVLRVAPLRADGAASAARRTAAITAVTAATGRSERGADDASRPRGAGRSAHGCLPGVPSIT
jgi:hypothetical protein